MGKKEERIFKKAYTDFDKRLDRELDEEREERRRQLLLQAPDFKLLNQMAENGEYAQELAVKLKAGASYYLRSREEENSDKFIKLLRKTLQTQPSIREDLIKQAGLLGCMAFKRDMPRLGRLCAETILSGMRLLSRDDSDISDLGYLQFKNVSDTAVRTRNDRDFQEIVSALYRYWNESNVAITPGLLSVLSGLLFVAADRRQIDALSTACCLSRSVLRHPSVNPVMRRRFMTEWSNTAAQIAQRGWQKECTLLLQHMCLFLASVRDPALIKKTLADVAVHIQMQSKWDGFRTAFLLYYPCQLFTLESLHWMLRKYNGTVEAEKELEVDWERQISGVATQLEVRMDFLTEKEETLDMIRFLLRNARDTAAGCARLLMQEEWEIYVAWQNEWLSVAAGKEKRRKQIRLFMQLVAEYWHSTQPSRSNRQWEAMAELLYPSQLEEKHMKLLQQVS